MTRTLMLSWLLVMSAAVSSRAQSTAAAVNQQTARRTVQRFYDWYVPIARRSSKPLPWMRALTHKGITFSPELARALRRDSVAQARAKGEIDGLDYDPFVNGQDFCRRYTVGNVTRRGSSFLIEVRGSGACARHSTPDAIMELQAVNGKLQVVNVRDPKTNGDLLSALARLEKRSHSR
jgi:hypothetical protein